MSDLLPIIRTEQELREYMRECWQRRQPTEKRRVLADIFRHTLVGAVSIDVASPQPITLYVGDFGSCEVEMVQHEGGAA